MSEHDPYASPAARMSIRVNNSGQGENVFPEGVQGWSWGAFFFGPLWAVFNRSYLGLLTLIPGLGLVMNVVLGLKGREWAWKNRPWRGTHHFNEVQARWSFAAVCLMLLLSLFVIKSVRSEIETLELYEAAGQFNEAASSLRSRLDDGAATASLAEAAISDIRHARSAWVDRAVLKTEVMQQFVHVTAVDKALPSFKVILSPLEQGGGRVQWACHITDSSPFDRSVFQWCES